MFLIWYSSKKARSGSEGINFINCGVAAPAVFAVMRLLDEAGGLIAVAEHLDWRGAIPCDTTRQIQMRIAVERRRLESENSLARSALARGEKDATARLLALDQMVQELGRVEADLVEAIKAGDINATPTLPNTEVTNVPIVSVSEKFETSEEAMNHSTFIEGVA